MGPKKKDDGPSKKTVEKAKDKIIEDKTFGLKNKNKSKAVQSYIKGVEQTVKGGKGQKDLNQEYAEKALKKKLMEEEAFLNSLSKSVKTIKQAEADDDDMARNMLCQFFSKQGFCEDGDKCKFSHDINIEFNQGTFDIYTDLRDAKSKLGIDFEMMEQKEAKRSKLPKTDIVCKFFLDAIKNKIYGWKWQCPNGDECHYKHCLPKDYVIQTLQGKIQEEMTLDEFQDLEEKIDMERERLAVGGTKVTEKVFLEWKKKREAERLKDPSAQNKKAELMKKLKTGRELFDINKDQYKDDENADDDVYENENNQIEEDTKNLQDELWGKNEEKTEIKVDSDLFKDDGGNLDDIDLDEEEKVEEDPDENNDN